MLGSNCILIWIQAKKKSKKLFWETPFQVYEQCSFWVNYGKCEKIWEC